MPGPRPSGVRAFARRFVIALGLSATIMVGAVVFVNYISDEKFDAIEKVDVETVEPATEKANFLIIGSDTRAFVATEEEEDAFGSASGEAGGQRSDTLMVVHVDPERGKAMVVSFPRDLWVEIPGVPLDEAHCARVAEGKCMAKINAAFNTGPDTVIATLQQNYGIPINHYLEIDFKTFEGIVDAIGEVPIYFPFPTRDDGTGLYTPVAGCHMLDGKGALAYARARHIKYYSYSEEDWYDSDATADLARIRRQQDFMRRLASRAVARSSSNPLIALEVVDRVVENLKVDDALEKDDLYALVDVFSDVDPESRDVEFVTLPARNGAAGTLSVLYTDEAGAAELLEVLRDGSGGPSGPSAASTTAPGSVTTAPGSVTTAPGSPTTTTTAPPLPVSNRSRFGEPAEVTAPCA